ncbi:MULTISPECIES: S8 family peptidase [Vibrio]|uniref:S8 family peptidase n=1 Tax=Vibrio TaxID=662 RepID=UPI00078E9E74|nr:MULTISPECIES: S8 family serine peptidase [Vibrio]BAU70902.1 hypothetical protein [Vibrio sp. 04Ya108]BBM67841.1 hypothetical protein VA249_44870 [Vibrio alfacsensis]BCN27011.1 hypothetical protein VYA_42030 [Vibrio alfacsensis]
MATLTKPTHIVIFDKPSQENEAIIKQIGDQDVKTIQHQPGKKTVQDATGNTVCQYYKRLSVATVVADKTLVETLKNNDKVIAVVPNEKRTIVQTSEDYLHGYLQGVIDTANLLQLQLNQSKNTPCAPTLPWSWCLENIGVSGDVSGKGVKVAVLDTGVYLDHPDFYGKLEDGVNAQSFIDGESVNDLNGHGTHCCGIVAGHANSKGKYRYSVAPDAELIVGKVLSDSGSGYDSDILEAIHWSLEQGARVISMSLGTTRAVGEPYPSAYEQIAKVMLDDPQGALFIAAAGNESERPEFVSPVGNPAACHSIMAVAAVDKENHVAYYSCAEMDDIGTLDISAPGSNVYSAWTGGGYKSISGTSMATPHVAGVAALYLEQNPSMTPRELSNILKSKAKALGEHVDYGAGLVIAPTN